MARKRGGLAGVWDRNKKIIKPIATLAAGALTGGVGGAVVGGLMNGLDREGKGGIGFDVGKGAMGAASGYGMGKIGGALKSGVMSRIGGQAAMKALPSAAPGAMAPSMAAAPSLSAPSAVQGGLDMLKAGGIPKVPSSFMGGVGNALRDGKTISALGATAVGGMNAYGQSQQNALARQQMERNNRIEDEDREREQAMDPVRARLLAMMLQRLGGPNIGMAS